MNGMGQALKQAGIEVPGLVEKKRTVKLDRGAIKRINEELTNNGVCGLTISKKGTIYVHSKEWVSIKNRNPQWKSALSKAHEANQRHKKNHIPAQSVPAMLGGPTA